MSARASALRANLEFVHFLRERWLSRPLQKFTNVSRNRSVESHAPSVIFIASDVPRGHPGLLTRAALIGAVTATVGLKYAIVFIKRWLSLVAPAVFAAGSLALPEIYRLAKKTAARPPALPGKQKAPAFDVNVNAAFALRANRQAGGLSYC